VLTRSILALVALAGCGRAPGSSAGPPVCPSGDVRIIDDDEAAALAACTVIDGDLVIDGAALRDVDALGRIEDVRGSLVIGPTLRLTTLGGLRSLRSVTADLDVSSNPGLVGVFFAALVRVGGTLSVERNYSAATISAHRLETVDGDVEISGNSSLLRLDLGRLERVGGSLIVEDNRQLDDMVIGQPEVVGERRVEAPAP
jgi:hypothetical protein